jgi:hypothetical protein
MRNKYTIERDGRPSGGKFEVVAEFEDWKQALAAWQSMPAENMTLWFSRVQSDGVLSLDCK